MPNAGGLTDREAAIDAVTRFVVSLDDADSDLLASSLTDDATLDLTPFSKAGLKSQLVQGRAAIVDILMSAVGRPLDTTHNATNFRCTVNGDNADLTCCVLAQHFRADEGPGPEFGECYTAGNQYSAALVRDEELWRVRTLRITPTWAKGNVDVMKV